MTTVLIVDDSAVDRLLAGGCLKETDLTVIYAANGREALDAIKKSPPAIVVTDLLMPEVDGIELVQEVKANWPTLPVVLMTAHGNEETAVTALRVGAASYVPKKNLARDLEETVRNVLAVASSDEADRQVLHGLKKFELQFEIGNDLNGLRPLISHIQSRLREMEVCNDSDILRVSTALQESLMNAVEHGNLEISSELREDGGAAYVELGKSRRHEEPYASRRVHVSAKMNRERLTLIVRDGGNGFDPNSLPDPTDPANVQKVSGRGLMLIRTFMDEVSFNEAANEITMVKLASE
jgi:CheY-like chemotaxis protein/anti-sigma regulatory factor (Ser/Thr protein kinase)